MRVLYDGLFIYRVRLIRKYDISERIGITFRITLNPKFKNAEMYFKVYVEYDSSKLKNHF